MSKFLDEQGLAKVAEAIDAKQDKLPAIAAGDASKSLTVNSTEDGVEWSTVGGGGSTELVEEITYDALKTKKNSSELVHGKWYRITDYAFSPNSSAYSGMRNGGHPFDILVMAISSNVLSEDAKACIHVGDTYYTNAGSKLEKWRLKYHFDNSDAFCDFCTTSGKGAIYFLEDDKGNSCGYDFKNLTKNYYYTFDLYTSGSHKDASVANSKLINNKIGIYFSQFQIKYGENIFKTTEGLAYVVGNVIDGSATNNTFSGNTYYNNVIHDGYWSNSFTGSCYDIEVDCSANHCSIGSDSNSIKIGSEASYIDLSAVSKARSIIVDANCSYVTFSATGSASDYMQNVHVHFGVNGTSSSPKAVTIARGLAYETNVQATGTTNIDV